MDKKLQEYRAKKEREQLLAKAKNSLKGLYDGLTLRTRKQHKSTSNLDEEPLIQEHLPDEMQLEYDDNDEVKILPDEEIDKITCCTYKDVFKYSTVFIIWLSFQLLFIKWEFGAIYFIITALLGIYYNTSTRKKSKGEVSAYSVFNKNCESIQGTVKAEDLEKQFIYGRLF